MVENIQAAIDAGKALDAASQPIRFIGDVPFLLTPADFETHSLLELLQASDKRAPAPRRLIGCAKFTELASFIEHVLRFKDADSAVFMSGNTLTAVYNYHKGTLSEADPAVISSPRWADHRAAYVAPFSAQWALWTKNDGEQMTQEQFGEFIDQNIADIAAPTSPEDRAAGYVGAGQLSTMARNLVINASHRAERKINEQTGEINMIFSISNDEQTSTKLPPGFLLGIPVFEAGAGYRVEAKFYLTRSGNGFKLSYKLARVPEVLKHAVDEIRNAVAKQTLLPVWAGSPES